MVKFLGLSVLFASVSALGFQSSILNWRTSDLSQDQAIKWVSDGVLNFVEFENNCQLEDLGSYEAVNGLRDQLGKPVLLVLSTAQTSGTHCKLAKYLDCETSLRKSGAVWVHHESSCQAESKRH